MAHKEQRDYLDRIKKTHPSAFKKLQSIRYRFI